MNPKYVHKWFSRGSYRLHDKEIRLSLAQTTGNRHIYKAEDGEGELELE